jgi:uncharacterized protein involved in exopolysaccharide biosynthesis
MNRVNASMDLPTRDRSTVDDDTIVTSDEALLGSVEEFAGRADSLATLRDLWQQRAFLGRVFVLCLVISTIVAFVIPKRYESTARLMPPSSGEGASAILSALAGRSGSMMPMAESVLGLKTTGELFVGVLQSETVQDDVIRKMDLQKVYRARYIEDARKDLAKHTEITEDRKSGIITIVATDRSQERAAAIVREYIAQLDWVVNNLTTSSAHRERVFLEERLRQVNGDLKTAEGQFSRFASQKGAIDIPSQGKAMFAAAAELQGQLIALESELRGMRQIYADSNVRVRSTEARIAELRRQLQKMGGGNTDENSTAEELYPSIRQLPLLGVDYADFMRNVKVQEAVFETLTREYELAKVQEAKEIPTVKVLDQPLVPQKKSFPPRLLFIVVGSVLGVFMGIVYIRVYASWSAMHTQDPRKMFATEVLQTTRAQISRQALVGLKFVRRSGSLPRPGSAADEHDEQEK